MSVSPFPAQPRGGASQAGHDIAALTRRYRAALARRDAWQGLWRDCVAFTLPQRDTNFGEAAPGAPRGDRLFDGTAPDAVDQLAASLLAELTPPWARWFGLAPGSELSEAEREAVAPRLETTAERLKTHFERSNFSVEIHQAYLDLITVGTASILFEEARPGGPSAFRFTAVPATELALEEGPEGRLDVTFRRSDMRRDTLAARFPQATLPPDLERRAEHDPEARFAVIEAVIPDGGAYAYTAFLDLGEAGGAGVDEDLKLAQGRFARSPFINFRWMKAAGEAYGRSPVMKALPDIKTANKVVELILKNASISVTGIWQADDDGVLNPANIKLVPGAIIPKAVGSQGLTPLAAPGSFDVSQLILEQLRGRITHALLGDRLGQIDAPAMTATEVLERSAEMARILGATYGRLQAELLTPLVARALGILARRGDVPGLVIDGRVVELKYLSPLARQQARKDAGAVLQWLGSLSQLGPAGMAAVDGAATARWLGRAMGVPEDLMRSAEEAQAEGGDVQALLGALGPLLQKLGGQGGQGGAPMAAAAGPMAGEGGDV
ncbi:portal protein [Roseospirillum parvum]|uniref:Bacteriophage head to tail connecting protein n=1 Tax=Roseospirillum parvum TaxID=83401 RepID=A0A1G7W7C4_9PROT|nr:portal protein [Roseospirillum parvum]SDG67848.1 Bacteriophage head to tail connecting protein [Roseospirillum parvum]